LVVHLIHFVRPQNVARCTGQGELGFALRIGAHLRHLVVQRTDKASIGPVIRQLLERADR
jgi:hypothetical protein